MDNLNRELTKVVMYAAEISSHLAVAGQQLDESLKAWSQGKVDEQLFRALDVKISCKEKCPSKLWSAVSCKQHASDLEIVVSFLCQLIQHISHSKSLLEDVIHVGCFFNCRRNAAESLSQTQAD